MSKNIENMLCLGLIAATLAMFIASLNFPEGYIWGVPDPNRPYQAEGRHMAAENDKNKKHPLAANIRQILAFRAAVKIIISV